MWPFAAGHCGGPSSALAPRWRWSSVRRSRAPLAGPVGVGGDARVALGRQRVLGPGVGRPLDVLQRSLGIRLGAQLGILTNLPLVITAWPRPS